MMSKGSDDGKKKKTMFQAQMVPERWGESNANAVETVL